MPTAPCCKATPPASRSSSPGAATPISRSARTARITTAPSPLRARSVTHARELAAWTDDAFDIFGIDETEEEARYRHAACLLADIGWRAHPEYRGTQSFNIIANGSFIGIDHPGRTFVALANLFRHEGINEDLVSSDMKALAGSRYVKRACILGALLRVVYLFSASMPGVIQKLKWQKGKGGALSLVVPASHAGLIGEDFHA